MNGAQARILNARKDADSRTYSQVIRKFCDLDPEPLAQVDGVFVGEVQIANGKPYREVARVIRTGRGNVMASGGLNSPIPSNVANKIFDRSDQWQLTHALHEDGAIKRRKLTNAKG